MNDTCPIIDNFVSVTFGQLVGALLERINVNLIAVQQTVSNVKMFWSIN